MPLKAGKGKSVIKKNIGEMLSSYKSSGKIGKTKPKSMAHAQKIAAAAAYHKAGSATKSKPRAKKSQSDVTSRIMGALAR